MKILFCGICSKYIHTMPSCWFLSEYLKSNEIENDEVYYNVNMPYFNVLEDLLKNEFDALLFSVYIFNVDFINKLVLDIKKTRPHCVIIAGGPECGKDFNADYVITGEGENALLNLIKNLSAPDSLGNFNKNEKVIVEDKIFDLDNIPSPYTENRLKLSKNKIIYYESSRGCPFKCTYCMASLSKGVRYFSTNRVKKDLINIVNSGAKIIKFTDRTFNADFKRAEEIFCFIEDNFSKSSACFHFEVAGDLFKSGTLKILQDMPKGLVQFEAGVQTLNVNSQKAIKRSFNKDIFFGNIKKIMDFKNIHVHIDLIAGLPLEDFNSFENSFNGVYSLKPHKIQLGFLKILKGTDIEKNYGISYNKNAPYEILSTPHLSNKEIMILKDIEYIVDRFYNSGRFTETLNFLETKFASAFKMFLFFSEKFIEYGYAKNRVLFSEYEFMSKILNGYSEGTDLLKFDYMLTNNSKVLPSVLKRQTSKTFREFIKNIKPQPDITYAEFNFLPAEKISGSHILRFDYSKKDKVTGKYSYYVIKKEDFR